MISNTLPINTVLKGNVYNYSIERILGQGSFGITYLARIKLSGSLGKLQSNITVAIKEFFMKDLNGRTGTIVLTNSNSELYYSYRKDFIREANHLSKLKHSNIVKVLESFENNNTAYFSMEYIDGGSLNDYIQLTGGLSEHDALRGIAQIAEALSLMHENKMLHLDIKPLNIMRRENGDWVLIDFGLSKIFNADGEPESSSRIGTGTMGYAPLEQINYKKTDKFPPTLDIYALGATLFKALTAVTPPDASTIFNEGFPEDIMRNRGICDDIIQLTSWAMEPLKRKRPQTVEEFLIEVNRILPQASRKQAHSLLDVHNSNKNAVISDNIEYCNNFEVHWDESLNDYKKDKIRELLFRMKYIRNKNVIAATDYGQEVVGTLPIMSLGEFAMSILQELKSDEITGGTYLVNNVRAAIEIAYQLEEWTKLPFRLATEKEIIYECSASSFHWEKLRTLCYSKEKGFQYITYYPTLIHDLEISQLIDNYDFQLVCDGTKPRFSQCGFNVPYTQGLYEKIEPIGFGFYAIKVNDLWNITRPESPLLQYLPHNYESISSIGVWGYPASFIGIIAKTGTTESYYEFNHDEFKFIKSLTNEDIKDRKC